MSTVVSQTWINGNLAEHITLHDRGLLYGQSVFETINVYQQKPFLLSEHLDRLAKGCQILSIDLDPSNLRDEINTVCKTVSVRAVLRVTLTMGQGERGYQNPTNPNPNQILSLSTAPELAQTHYTDGIQLGVATIRLANQPALAGLKHGNRLEQIMARSQWLPDWHEALLLDQNDQVIEATQSNVFIVKDGTIRTPELNQAGVAGVIREFILSNASGFGVECQVVPLSIDDITNADEVFVTNSLIGLWPVKKFQQRSYAINKHSISQQLLSYMQDHEAIPTI